MARAAEQAGIVLLSNRHNLLPLAEKQRCLLVTGANSDAGVPAGGGSSQVTPVGGAARDIALGGEGIDSFFRRQVYDGRSPLATLRARLPGVKIIWLDGRYPNQAAQLAQLCSSAIVFAQQWSGEASDIPDMSLPSGQDALIDAVTRANPNTVVVLQTAGPVAMPWLAQAGAVVEAWYGGSGGAAAIVSVLLGDANPSGHLPISFPASIADLPNIALGGQFVSPGDKVDIYYREGGNAGYRWYATHPRNILFPFGFGLSYTSFAYSNLAVQGGATLSVSFDIRNTGTRAGADVPQLYLTQMEAVPVQRLLGWQREEIQPGQTAHVSLTVDPRLLAHFQALPPHFHVPGGSVQVAVGANATDLRLRAQAEVTARDLPP